MKLRTKSVIFVIILLLVTIGLSLITISYAKTDFEIQNVNVTVTRTKAEINWNEAKEAEGYEIYLDLPYIGYQNIGNVVKNKVFITGFEEGEIYGVKIRAYKHENNKKIYSNFSDSVNFQIGENTKTTSKLGKVGNIKAESYGTFGNIQWDSVEKATGYEIYASVANSNFVNLGSTKETNVKITGMNQNEVYSIKIKPFLEESGEKIYGTFSNIAILKYDDDKEEKLTKITGLKVTMQEDNAKLTWNKLEDADGYEIVVNIPTKGEARYDSKENCKVLKGFSSHYTYKARVRAYKYINGKKEYGDYSNYISIRYERNVKKVEGLTVKTEKDKATFSWNLVDGADGYEVVVNIPGIGDCKYNVTGTTKTLTGFTETKYDYTVKVRAYEYINGYKVYGDYSSKKYFRNEEHNDIDKVDGLYIEVDGNEAYAEWNKVYEANGYEMAIYVPGRGEYKYRTTKNNATIKGITGNRNYYIKVRAYKNINGNEVYGEYSNKVYFKNGKDENIDKITGLKVIMNGDRATFSWNEVKNIDGYEVIVNIPGSGNSKYLTTTTSKTLSGFSSYYGECYVQVRAYRQTNGKLEYGEYSNKVYFRNKEDENIDKVTGLSVKRNGQAATFKWNKISNADGYEIVVNIPGIGDCKYDEKSTSRYMTGFTETKYKYKIKVRAYKYISGRKVYGNYSNIVEF